MNGEAGRWGGMAVIEPLPRRDAPSCRGAIFCARTFNALSDSGIQHGGGGIEGRAQNIAPLHLMRCLIVGCSGMEMKKKIGFAGKKTAMACRAGLWMSILR